MDEIDISLGTLETAKGSKKKLYTYSLKAWKEYCTMKVLLPHKAVEKDIDGFVSWGMRKKDWDMGTVINYLAPLAAFFKKYNPALRDYILRKQKDLKNLKDDVETKKREQGQSLVFDIALKLLEAADDLRDRLCLWLVSVEGMSNLCLEEMQVRHIDFRQMTYSVGVGSPERRMHPSTIKLIEACKNKYRLKPEDRLLNIRQRSMQNLPKRYAKKIRLPQWNEVTLSKLRRLGNNDDLRKLLVRAYEKKTLLPSS